MQLLVNKAIEDFLASNHAEILHARDSAMHRHVAGQDWLQDRHMLDWAAHQTGKPVEEMFEDFGAWLARQESTRRLLRFSGRNFAEFVVRLEELPGRAHMVSENFAMPPISVRSGGMEMLQVTLPAGATRWTALLAGMVRVMADDYGALGLISVEGHVISVQISDEEFADGRDFSLSPDPSKHAQHGQK